MNIPRDLDVSRFINHLHHLIQIEANYEVGFREFFIDHIKKETLSQLNNLKVKKIIFDYKIFSRNNDEFDIWIQQTNEPEFISLNFYPIPIK